MARTICIAAAQTGPVHTEDLAEKLPISRQFTHLFKQM